MTARKPTRSHEGPADVLQPARSREHGRELARLELERGRLRPGSALPLPEVFEEVHYVLSSAIASPISSKPRIRRRTDMMPGSSPGIIRTG
jgi:hypothetical protein